jgi:hypothetical protein
VWIYPAYINHSCAHNCENVFIGDVMFIYAKRDIAKGEEITHRYFNEVFVADRQRIAKTGTKGWRLAGSTGLSDRFWAHSISLCLHLCLRLRLRVSV